MKIRDGFVSNSSSSSFLCLGVSDENLIKKLLKAENPKEIVEDNFSYYEGEGHGCLEAKHIMFFGNSEYWQAAGLGEGSTLSILENKSLKEARKVFVKLMKDKLGVDIPEKSVSLQFGEASSE
uniref:Uncharacterized protein n=1 Tax=viral metagenome TaxID=1070528 RepID=A0A6M3KZ83_9ZZZZ